MSYDKAQAIREFRRWSQGYDRCILQRLLFEPSHRAIIAGIRAQSAIGPLAVLDVGCGTGVFAAQIRACLPKSKVWGVDLVAAMLVQGQALALGFRSTSWPFRVIAERLPLPSGAFDVVTCANSFHHYPHQDRAVAEMHRVLQTRRAVVPCRRVSRWSLGAGSSTMCCVAGVEGDVLHASARRVRDLFRRAGFVETDQKIHHRLAPFLLTEGVTRSRAIPSRHSSAGRTAQSASPQSGSSNEDCGCGGSDASELLQHADQPRACRHIPS